MTKLNKGTAVLLKAKPGIRPTWYMRNEVGPTRKTFLPPSHPCKRSQFYKWFPVSNCHGNGLKWMLPTDRKPSHSAVFWLELPAGWPPYCNTDVVNHPWHGSEAISGGFFLCSEGEIFHTPQTSTKLRDCYNVSVMWRDQSPCGIRHSSISEKQVTSFNHRTR